MMMHRYLLSIAFVCSSLLMHAQNSNENCKDLIRECSAKMSAMYGKSDPKKVYHMDMTVDSYYRPEARIPDTHVTIKMYVSGNKVQYESNYVSMYSDLENSFTIVHPQKVIVWNDGRAIVSDKTQYEFFTRLQDTLMLHSTVSSFKNVTENGRSFKIIALKPDKMFLESTGIMGVIYYYDVKEKRIFKFIAKYTADSEMREEVITYTKLSFNAGSMPFSHASEQVMNAQGMLHTKYRQYEIIDNRNSSGK